MKRVGLLLGFLAVLAFFLPTLVAQDAKKKAEKTDEKSTKKDPADKDPDKDPKKDPKTEEPKPKKEKFVYGTKFITKIISIKAESNREFTIQVQEIDPQKVYNLNVWKNQQMQNLTNQQLAIARATSIQSRLQAMQTYQRGIFDYQKNLASRQNDIYRTKNVDVFGGENAKVRSYAPPVEFDDQGFLKKYTKKELDALKDKAGLPGYFPAEFDAIRPGQFVEIYMAKPPAPVKGKKKGPADDDIPMEQMRPEYVLVVILADRK